MKRTNIYQYERQNRIQIKREKLRLSRKDKSYNERKFKASKTVMGYSIMPVPKNLVLYDKNNEREHFLRLTLEFLSKLRNNSPSNRILLDFSETVRIDAAALVILYAKCEELIKVDNLKFKYSLPKTCKKVRLQLRRSFLLRLLEGSDTSFDFTKMKMLPVIRGTHNKGIEELIDYILEHVLEGNATADQEHFYSDAISETVNNVGLHAYPGRDIMDKKWWLLCQVIDNQLFLAIYDTGVGIPKTVVKQPYFIGKFQNLFPVQFNDVMTELLKIGVEKNTLTSITDKFIALGILTDQQSIMLSMTPDISGTQKDKHGQGSKSIRKLIEETDEGKLWVLSCKGLYLKEKGEEPTTQPLPGHLGGTLIQWNIQIK